MLRKKYLLVLLIVAVAFLTGCPPRVVPPEMQLTPLEQAEKNCAVWLHVWNQQFNDHVAMSKMTNLTKAQKEILNKKADLLEQSKPLLDLYVSTVRGGLLPESTTEQQLMTLMNQLSQMAIGFAQ